MTSKPQGLLKELWKRHWQALFAWTGIALLLVPRLWMLVTPVSAIPGLTELEGDAALRWVRERLWFGWSGAVTLSLVVGVVLDSYQRGPGLSWMSWALLVSLPVTVYAGALALSGERLSVSEESRNMLDEWMAYSPTPIWIPWIGCAAVLVAVRSGYNAIALYLAGVTLALQWVGATSFSSNVLSPGSFLLLLLFWRSRQFFLMAPIYQALGTNPHARPSC